MALAQSDEMLELRQVAREWRGASGESRKASSTGERRGHQGGVGAMGAAAGLSHSFHTGRGKNRAVERVDGVESSPL
ncbi:hypothetical protein O9K51_01176 [Purpureocillium lavendulum]|uniref:Uncharacterized protein n=1 Tax=Purpureocillium lavendulum TaxID=1247861 RepID=A0AB34G5T1_9HYPO|nr:hypothetical protein O9K51_01176 [Purpureocillium lavendulum]